MRLMLFSGVILGGAIAAGVALAETDEMTGTSKPVLQQAEAAMAHCANIWAIKTDAGLDAETARLEKRFDHQEKTVKDEIEVESAHLNAARRKVEDAQKEVGTAVAKIVEDRAKSGTPVDFKTAEQLAKAQGSSESVRALQAAERELAYLESRDAYLRAWFASLGVLRAAVDACVKDQRDYLGARTDRDATTTSSVSDPPPTRVTGSWQGGCVDEAGARTEHSGSVTFDISPREEQGPGEGTVTGEFDVDGTRASLKGTWYKNLSFISVTGHVGEFMWGITGKVATAAGKTQVTGDVAGRLAKSSCLGNFTAR